MGFSLLTFKYTKSKMNMRTCGVPCTFHGWCMHFSWGFVYLRHLEAMQWSSHHKEELNQTLLPYLFRVVTSPLLLLFFFLLFFPVSSLSCPVTRFELKVRPITSIWRVTATTDKNTQQTQQERAKFSGKSVQLGWRCVLYALLLVERALRSLN